MADVYPVVNGKDLSLAFSPRELMTKTVQAGLAAVKAYPFLIDGIHREYLALVQSDVHREDKRWSMSEVARRVRRETRALIRKQRDTRVPVSQSLSPFFSRVMLYLYPDFYKGRIYTRRLGRKSFKIVCPCCDHEMVYGDFEYDHNEGRQADDEVYNG